MLFKITSILKPSQRRLNGYFWLKMAKFHNNKSKEFEQNDPMIELQQE